MNLRETSRLHYGTRSDRADREEINIGSFQRIADALEAMSGPYLKLLNEAKYFSERNKENNAEIGRLNRRIRSLRGVITKMKKERKK